MTYNWSYIHSRFFPVALLTQTKSWQIHRESLCRQWAERPIKIGNCSRAILSKAPRACGLIRQFLALPKESEGALALCLCAAAKDTNQQSKWIKRLGRWLFISSASRIVHKSPATLSLLSPPIWIAPDKSRDGTANFPAHGQFGSEFVSSLASNQNFKYSHIRMRVNDVVKVKVKSTCF